MTRVAASAAPDARQWECYDCGVWYAMPAHMSGFLESMYLAGFHTTAFPIGLPPYTAKYEWNFRELLQYRKHYEGQGQWVTVKTCSIRRIRVMDAPESPRG